MKNLFIFNPRKINFDYSKFCDYKIIFELDENSVVDYFLSFGGDGTFLQMFHLYKDFIFRNKETILTGINYGHLGFLTLPRDFLRRKEILNFDKDENLIPINRKILTVKNWNKNEIEGFP